jgi:hypothetical protein
MYLTTVFSGGLWSEVDGGDSVLGELNMGLAFMEDLNGYEIGIGVS